MVVSILLPMMKAFNRVAIGSPQQAVDLLFALGKERVHISRK
jgi:hypothetical protein